MADRRRRTHGAHTQTRSRTAHGGAGVCTENAFHTRNAHCVTNARALVHHRSRAHSSRVLRQCVQINLETASHSQRLLPPPPPTTGCILTQDTFFFNWKSIPARVARSQRRGVNRISKVSRLLYADVVNRLPCTRSSCHRHRHRAIGQGVGNRAARAARTASPWQRSVWNE